MSRIHITCARCGADMIVDHDLQFETIRAHIREQHPRAWYAYWAARKRAGRRS